MLHMRGAERGESSKDDFASFERGIVRLSAPLARDVAALTFSTVSMREIVANVEEIAKLFERTY
jgi:hypothetical protein